MSSSSLPPLRVWAPTARAVDVVTCRGRFAMSADGDGYFFCPAPLPPGTDYSFSVDGSDPLPDPRSPFQPHGVFGASRRVDTKAFAFTDRSWTGMHLPSAVIYELHVGTFSPEGTFDGVRARLDHLVDLGATAIELMPVAEFSGERGWGYDGVDLFAPHHAYGGPEALARLVDACHARGLGVVLDVVYNHLGPAGNFLERFGPYFTSRHATPWGKAINFDGADSGPVRDFFCENALMWLEDYHIDALRLDAVHAIVDTSAVHILEELAGRVERLGARLGRRLHLVAESDLNDPKIVRSRDAGGYGIDAQWSDDFHHALHALLTGERQGYYTDFGSLADVASALARGFVYDGRYSRSRRRVHGRPLGSVPAHRLLGYTQTHDQVGNRALGERSAALMSLGKLKIAAALVLTSPFIPMLFQGEEWGTSSPFLYFTDHHDPELGRAVSDGRRREFAAFGWNPAEVPDPQDRDTFARSKLRWDELERSPQREIFAWYKELIRLRRELPALSDGRFEATGVRFDDQAGWIVVARGADVLLAANVAGSPVHLEHVTDVVPASAASMSESARRFSGSSMTALGLRDGSQGWSIALRSDAACEWDQRRLHLAPESVAVLVRT